MFQLPSLLMTVSPAKGLEVQVHHLISLGGWNDVIYLSIYLTNGPQTRTQRSPCNGRLHEYSCYYYYLMMLPGSSSLLDQKVLQYSCYHNVNTIMIKLIFFSKVSMGLPMRPTLPSVGQWALHRHLTMLKIFLVMITVSLRECPH